MLNTIGPVHLELFRPFASDILDLSYFKWSLQETTFFCVFICINYFFSSVFMLTKVSSWKNNENYSCKNDAKHCGLHLHIFDLVWPEIKFIFFYFSLKGESVYQYEGDRTRDDIVNFALRLVGPSVNQIESKEDFEDAKSKVIYNGVSSTFTTL